MEATQSNNSTTPNQEDLDTQKKAAANSKELKENANKFVTAATHAGICYFVPGPFVPVVIVGVEVAKHVVTNPIVQEKAGEVANRIGSTSKDVYTWTAKTASSVKEKTTQIVSENYNNTKDKANQAITAAKEQIPWDKINQITSSVPIPNILQRSSTPTPSINNSAEDNRTELRAKL